MTLTIGIIIGVTLFFTVCSIVLNRRSQDEDEFSLSLTKATWENGGRDLTSPMMGGGEIEVVTSPRFQPLTPPPGSRMRPVDAPPEARPVTPPPLPALMTAMRISIESAPALPAAIAPAPVEEGPVLSEEIIRGLEQIPPLPKGVQAL